MKKIFFAMLCSVVLSITSCDGNRPENQPPIGVWQSDDPYMVIYIESQESGNHYGVYHNGSDVIEVTFHFAGLTNNFRIRDTEKWNKYNEEGDLVERDKYEYFNGTFKVQDNVMYYTIRPKWQELRGISEIVFTKIE